MTGFNITCAPGLLRLSGEIDLAAAPDIVTAGTTALASSDELVIDLGAVTFLDSTALGALIELNNAATDKGATFTLRNVPDRVHRILDLTGLSEAFNILTVFDIGQRQATGT